MKELKDYLHLYLGCKLRYKRPSDGVYTFTTVGQEELGYRFSDMKLLLRPLSSMTEEEMIWMFVLRATANNTTVDKQHRRSSLEGTFLQIEFGDSTSDYQDIKTLYPEQTKFLLSVGIDLFGLIESGLAIDSTALKQTP